MCSIPSNPYPIDLSSCLPRSPFEKSLFVYISYSILHDLFMFRVNSTYKQINYIITQQSLNPNSETEPEATHHWPTWLLFAAAVLVNVASTSIPLGFPVHCQTAVT